MSCYIKNQLDKVKEQFDKATEEKIKFEKKIQQLDSDYKKAYDEELDTLEHLKEIQSEEKTVIATLETAQNKLKEIKEKYKGVAWLVKSKWDTFLSNNPNFLDQFDEVLLNAAVLQKSIEAKCFIAGGDVLYGFYDSDGCNLYYYYLRFKYNGDDTFTTDGKFINSWNSIRHYYDEYKKVLVKVLNK